MSFFKRLTKAAEKLGEVAGRAAVDAYELVGKVEDRLEEVVATIDRGIEAGLKSGYEKRHGKTADEKLVDDMAASINHMITSMKGKLPESGIAELLQEVGSKQNSAGTVAAYAVVKEKYETLFDDKDLFKDTAPAPVAAPSAEEASFRASVQEGLATGDTGIKATVNKAARKPAAKKVPAAKKPPAKKTSARKPN